jgi:hypothetical protein
MPHFDADQWSVLLITVIFGAARWIVAAFAVRPLMSQLGQLLRQLAASGLPRSTDIFRAAYLFRLVPGAAVA